MLDIREDFVMEHDEAPAQDRAESLIFATVYTFLAVVLMVSLAVGGRDLVGASAGRGIDSVPTTTTTPLP